MCGITGLLSLGEAPDQRHELLEHSLKRIAHRGPDAQQCFRQEGVALGHARLSIIEPGVGGAQPMQDPSGRYTIVFNGEVYNDPELRSILSEEGVPFHSNSDTELFLHWLIARGTKGLESVNGFFAFALWDREERSLLIGRDRYGIKPLFFREEASSVLFASELDALLAFGIPKEIDQQALRCYLQLTYVPAPLSMIEGVRKLMPGQWVKRSPNGKVEGRLEQGMEPEAWTGSFEEAVEAFREFLRSAVRDRLRSDVPLGTFLSGGMDSGIISALAVQEQKGLPSFSIGYEDPAFDESQEAERTAAHIGTEHHTFRVRNEDLVEGSEQVLEGLDEPFADSSAIPVRLLSKWSRQHVKAVLSGDGADELLGGYNKHRAEYLARHPGPREKLALWGRPIWQLLPKGSSGRWKESLRRLERFAQGADLSPEQRYWLWASFTSLEKASGLLNGGIPEGTMERCRKELFDGLRFDDMNAVLRSDRSFVLPNDMLTKLDRMSMAVGLEARVPFLDHRCVRLIESLPSDGRIDRRERKILLKRAFGELLPPGALERPKKGFEVPLADMLRKNYHQELMAYSEEGFLKEQAIFEPERVKEEIRSWERGKINDNGATIWSILVFQRWWDRHFN